MKLKREQFGQDFIAQMVSDIQMVQESYLDTLDNKTTLGKWGTKQDLAAGELTLFVEWLQGREDD